MKGLGIYNIKKVTISLVFLIAFTALIVWIVWGNTALEANTITISSKRIPKAFNGFRIAHISDLHNAKLGAKNEKLLSMLGAAKPDIIVITGDIIDSRHTEIDIATDFAKEAVKLAPCYFVTGNHEARISTYTELEAGLIESGVTILHDEEAIIERDGGHISLLGIDDPNFTRSEGGANSISPKKISGLRSTDGYSVLLSHRPEFFLQYCAADIDLALCGHAHGGQIRLPFIGGLVAPGQGLFPKYYSGLYTNENTNMIVSRGIGNSIAPLRFNNRPEIVLVELTSA